jgi:hypothetical protein
VLPESMHGRRGVAVSGALGRRVSDHGLLLRDSPLLRDGLLLRDELLLRPGLLLRERLLLKTGQFQHNGMVRSHRIGLPAPRGPQ